jgi:acetyl-CoA carboxylase biotin carboxyl carrier protein
MNLTDDDVREILRLLESSEFDELHLATDRFKLTLRRSGPDGSAWTEERETLTAPRAATIDVAPAAAPAPVPTRAPGPASRPATRVTSRASRRVAASTAVTGAAPGSAASGSEAAAASRILIDVHPPLIGTFYRAPKPGAAPFVEVGADVTETSVIGIVETMKLMNSVYAGGRGKVVEICAANGQLVDQDDVLMRLAPEPG